MTLVTPADFQAERFDADDTSDSVSASNYRRRTQGAGPQSLAPRRAGWRVKE
jgi:hypothetical protein